MNKIDEMIAQAEAEARKAALAGNRTQKDRHLMRSERLLDAAWSLNEADDSLPHLVSGLWCARDEQVRKAA